MSGSYTNTDGRSDSFNTGAAHDSGLYDPNRYDNQIVAVYEDRAAANAARDALLGAGIPQSAVQVLDRTAGDAVTGTSRAEDSATGTPDEGFWGAIKSLFVPDEEYHAYHHAIDRGHAMVIVTPSADMDRQRAIEILESSNPIDFDAKLEEWRQAGYDYSSAPRATAQDRSEASSGTGYTAGTVGAIGAAEGMGTSGSAMAATAATTPMSTSSTAAVPPPRTSSVDTRAGMAAENLTGNQDTIKVIEERMRIGKREVAQGAVRVRSYVVERPVEEQVHLHEERITLERRPVDRPATEGDTNLFQERTIEARATSEEAVVAKEARVVEEIGIRKEAQDRTETVRDTVRETKVEVEDDTKTRRTGGTTTSTTPGVTTSGTNPTRK